MLNKLRFTLTAIVIMLTVNSVTTRAALFTKDWSDIGFSWSGDTQWKSDYHLDAGSDAPG